MTRILFQMYSDGELHDLGVIENGEVVENIEENFENWLQWELGQPTTPDPDDVDAILETYEGPHLIAKTID